MFAIACPPFLTLRKTSLISRAIGQLCRGFNFVTSYPYRIASASGPDQIPSQSPLELLHPDRHLHRVERILYDVVPVQLIAPPHHDVRVRLLRAGEQQELDARRRLEARQAEVARFEALDASGGRSARVGLCGRGRDGVYGARDGVDAVEGSGEDERIVGSEVLEAWREGAVVDLQRGLRISIVSQTLCWVCILWLVVPDRRLC